MGNNSNEKDSLFKTIARFFKYNTRIVIIIVFFTGLISVAVFGNKGILQRIKLEDERKDLESQLNIELKKSQDLRKELELLKTSDEELERIAREKFGMTKDGEKIYKVTVDSTKQ